ncbi:hypothetical protein D1J36_008685 [Riemerella anatipestifer]|uniref:hypothetical protein n=1 Tax=Riemerella anatipestifer TaxID=34085 RepID=UPI0012AE1768|nr:hypothetical protein [Riemerella anatipestifer]USL95345.1 hypothetical protein D1J36_008685 [Riemerella anatipestifer]
MKTQILLFSIVVGSFMVSAQENKLKTYSKKVDSIVLSEKQLMNKEIDSLEILYSDKKLSHENLLNQKSEIARKYEQRINTKIQEEKKTLEEFTKEQVRHRVLSPENDTIRGFFVIRKNSIDIRSSKKKTPASLLKKSGLSVSYAFLNLTENAGSLNPFETASNMRIGNSHSFEVQARKERQIGNTTSPLFIRYGLAYRSDTYMPKRPLVFQQENRHLQLSEFQEGSLKRSKLRHVYLTFPIEFQYVLNPSYTEYKGKSYLDNSKKQWRIGFGAYGGINLRSLIKVKYYNEDGKFKKYQNKVDYGVNSFLFGAKFSLSYGGFNLFIKKDFTPIFNDEALIPSKNGIQIGLDIMNLNF